METFGADLMYVMQNQDSDKDILDNHKINKDFICHIVKEHFAKEETTVVSVKKVDVVDGPNTSSISTSIIVKFEVVVLPPWNVEEEIKMAMFVKTRTFRGPLDLSVRLCHKEIEIYEELFADMKEYLDHPVKGPFIAPISQVMFSTHNKDTPMLVLPSLTEYGYYSPKDRSLNRSEIKSVLKTLAKLHADGIKFLRVKKPDRYPYMKASLS